MKAKPPPVAWSIAGSDSCAGAGIQADRDTMKGLGVYACTVVTAVTAQNTLGVQRVEHVSPAMLSAQLESLTFDLPPRAIKLGMLGCVRNVEAVADFLEHNVEAFVVCDPVMTSSSGVPLLDLGAGDLFRTKLLQRVDLLTPNIHEAERLSEQAIRAPEGVEKAAAELLRRGARSVLIKGGHLEGTFCQDFWTDGAAAAWITSERREVRHTHGTGCTLSSAIAAGIALGLRPLAAAVVAKAYVNQGLREGGGIGHGRGPLAHGGWPSHPEDLPWITPSAEAGRSRLVFPNCGAEPLGFYPIVDRAEKIAALLSLGVRTVQLRAKDLHGDALEEEIRKAAQLGRDAGARVFINDFWEEALRCNAYGVHLGQEDMASADLPRLAAAGLRVGLSACSFEELARARAVQPSCIGIGSVFATPSKQIDYTPLGVENFARLCRLAGVPVVAIGGVTLENAPLLRQAGAGGMSVISDIQRADDFEGRVRDWLSFFAASP